MSIEAEIVGAWPLGASLALAAAVNGVREGRRRTALNEAVHELRRPLQVLALAGPLAADAQPALAGSLRLAAAALERLEGEINGEPLGHARERLPARPLAEEAVARWRPRAALAGRRLQLRWRAGEAAVLADRSLLAQALDNLVVNAIEHGGPEVAIAGEVRGGRLRLAVIDSGARGLGVRRRLPPGPAPHRSARRRRGHGLKVVRRTAAALGGEFSLRVSPLQTRALLELPIASAPVAEGGAGRSAAEEPVAGEELAVADDPVGAGNGAPATPTVREAS